MQREWLDLDDDGVVLLSYEPVVLSRFTNGEMSLVPVDWPQAEVTEEFLNERIEERVEYFDLNESGRYDNSDLLQLIRALGGFPIKDRDLLARIRNLLPERDSAVKFDTLRWTTRSPVPPLQVGNTISLTLHLDSLRRLNLVQALTEFRPPVLRILAFHPSERLRGKRELVVTQNDSGFELNLKIGEEPGEPISAGIGPLGVLELELTAPSPNGWVELEWSVVDEGLRGEAMRVPTIRHGSPKVKLEACLLEEGPSRMLQANLYLEDHLPLNYIELDINYSPGHTALERFGPADLAEGAIGALWDDDTENGVVRMLLYHPAGNFLLENLVSPQLGTLTFRLDNEDSDPSRVLAVRTRAAYWGTEQRAYRGARLDMSDLDPDPCPDGQEACEEQVRQLDGRRAALVLLHSLFGAGEALYCFDAYDVDADGRVTIHDAIV